MSQQTFSALHGMAGGVPDTRPQTVGGVTGSGKSELHVCRLAMLVGAATSRSGNALAMAFARAGLSSRGGRLRCAVISGPAHILFTGKMHDRRGWGHRSKCWFSNFSDHQWAVVARASLAAAICPAGCPCEHTYTHRFFLLPQIPPFTGKSFFCGGFAGAGAVGAMAFGTPPAPLLPTAPMPTNQGRGFFGSAPTEAELAGGACGWCQWVATP